MEAIDFSNDRKNDRKLAVFVQNVHLSFGFWRSKQAILKGVNLNIEQGTIYGLLGPSGCGKTTLLKCIIATLKPISGIIKVFDIPTGLAAGKIPGSGVGYMPQELALYFEHTINESLTFYGRLHHMKKKDIESRITFLLDFLRLPDKNKLISNLSGGEQRRVSFAIALLHQPPLLILDEPTVGVDPILRKNIWNYLVKLSTEQNVTIILTTHYVEEAKQANTVALMRDGLILAEEQPDQLIARYEARNLEDVFLKLAEKQSDMIYDNKSYAKSAAKEVLTTTESYSQYKKQFSDYIPTPSLRRIGAIAIINYIEMWRNMAFLLSQFISPGFQIALIFWSFGSDPHDLNVAVFNQDYNFGAKYLHHLNSKTIHQIPVKSMAEGEELVSLGKAWAVLNIWPNFTTILTDRFSSCGQKDISITNSSLIHIKVDNTNYQITGILQSTLYQATESFFNDLLYEIGPKALLTKTPVEYDEPIYGLGKPTSEEFLSPGILMNLMFYLALNITSLSLIMAKANGLLHRIYVSGAISVEVMCGHIITQFGVMVLHVCIMLSVAMIGFNVKNQGSLPLIFFLCLCQSLAGMTLGFLISVICDKALSALLLSIGIFYPILLTSGALWPVEAMPDAMQTISSLYPTTLAINAMGWILLHGRGITWRPVWIGFVTTWAWIILLTILIIILMRIRK